MIQLPTDWMEILQVSPQGRAVYLAVINDAGQYWVYYQQIDLAIPLQKLLEDLTLKLSPEMLSGERARYLYRDLHEELAEPSDQNWRPLPLLVKDCVSMEQYKAMNGMSGGLESSPPPAPAVLPNDPDL